MIIRVTEDHIRRGWRYASCSCPIALAMQEAGITDPSVGPHSVFWDHPRKMAPLPQHLRAWVLAFDRHERVMPVEFEMPEPLSPAETALVVAGEYNP